MENKVLIKEEQSEAFIEPAKEDPMPIYKESSLFMPHSLGMKEPMNYGLNHIQTIHPVHLKDGGGGQPPKDSKEPSLLNLNHAYPPTKSEAGEKEAQTTVIKSEPHDEPMELTNPVSRSEGFGPPLNIPTVIPMSQMQQAGPSESITILSPNSIHLFLH